VLASPSVRKTFDRETHLSRSPRQTFDFDTTYESFEGGSPGEAHIHVHKGVYVHPLVLLTLLLSI